MFVCQVHFLMNYICNFHVLIHFLLINICKLHLNRRIGRASQIQTPQRSLFLRRSWCAGCRYSQPQVNYFLFTYVFYMYWIIYYWFTYVNSTGITIWCSLSMCWLVCLTNRVKVLSPEGDVRSYFGSGRKGCSTGSEAPDMFDLSFPQVHRSFLLLLSDFYIWNLYFFKLFFRILHIKIFSLINLKIDFLLLSKFLWNSSIQGVFSMIIKYESRLFYDNQIWI